MRALRIEHKIVFDHKPIESNKLLRKQAYGKKQHTRSLSTRYLSTSESSLLWREDLIQCLLGFMFTMHQIQKLGVLKSSGLIKK